MNTEQFLCFCLFSRICVHLRQSADKISARFFSGSRFDLRTASRAILAICGLVPAAPLASARDFVLAGYNIANYAPLLEADRGKPGKSAEAAEAVIQAIKAINPDILGICEMGPPRQFEEFRKRLTGAGLAYSDFEFLEAADPDRHLALVSRFPIVARHSQPDVPYESNGTREKVKRGFLDVTLEIQSGFRLRVVGAHLKSKRPSPGGAEDVLRRNEAHLLRNRIGEILAENPEVNLVVFGDFNDTKDQPAIQEIVGRRGAVDSLTDLAPQDELGDRWTHYWKVDDVYARIDYLFVNRALSPRVVRDRSYVYRSSFWDTASDHRPVVATFHIPES